MRECRHHRFNKLGSPKRDVPGDQIPALDRLKDRTGFHILMDSAADAVGYEASQHGEGLLTLHAAPRDEGGGTKIWM